MTTRYITTPIYYLNGEPHLGHVYTTIAADVLARYWRLSGAKVKFLVGTDEHGQKVAQAAEVAGESPKDYVDRLSKRFKNMATEINASNDIFIRTTETRHHEAVQALWKNLSRPVKFMRAPIRVGIRCGMRLMSKSRKLLTEKRLLGRP